jgi:hypothetical protein
MQSCTSPRVHGLLARFWMAWACLFAIASRLCRPPASSVAALSASYFLPSQEEADTSAAEEATAVQERFAAWESARAEELQAASACEQRGLQLLSRATLLRTAVDADDKGLMLVADELRRRAHDHEPDEDDTDTDLQTQLITQGDEAAF